MKLLRRRTARDASAVRPAARYLAAGADEARRLGHTYVGTEHVLLALTRTPQGGAARILRELGVTHRDIENSQLLAGLWAPRIDRGALASLGIDLDAVRERLDDAFGAGALDETQAGMLEPSGGTIKELSAQLEESLVYAVARARHRPVRDEHMLLGILSVSDSLAARALAELRVSLPDAEALVHGEER